MKKSLKIIYEVFETRLKNFSALKREPCSLLALSSPVTPSTHSTSSNYDFSKLLFSYFFLTIFKNYFFHTFFLQFSKITFSILFYYNFPKLLFLYFFITILQIVSEENMTVLRSASRACSRLKILLLYVRCKNKIRKRISSHEQLGMQSPFFNNNMEAYHCKFCLKKGIFVRLIFMWLTSDLPFREHNSRSSSVGSHVILCKNKNRFLVEEEVKKS